MSDPTEELEDQSARAGSPKTRNRQTVFYVYDNPKALRVLTSVLEGCGYKVVIACNAGEAVERMERNAFDVVLLTYRLPRMISFKLARQIKLLSPSTPIVLVSGHTSGARGIDLCRRICRQRRDSGQLADPNAATYRPDMRSVPLL